MTPASPEIAASHDVVIVGGGLVGASLAISLDRIGVDTALVEATPAGALPPVFDQRNLSFAEASVNGLTALGVMQKLRAPTGPIRRIHVSRMRELGRVMLDAAAYGRETFGQVVVARDFGEALEARLLECRRLSRYRPARFAGFVAATGSRGRVMRIEDDAGSRLLAARLVVAADGTRSGVRADLGIAARESSYDQILFVARVRTGR